MYQVFAIQAAIVLVRSGCSHMMYLNTEFEVNSVAELWYCETVLFWLGVVKSGL